MSNTRRQALIVDDTDANRFFFERLLIQTGFEIKSAATGTEAYKLMAEQSFDLAIFDMQIGDANGLDLTRHLRQQDKDVCIVVATMHDERELIQTAFNRGCDIFVVKPYGCVELYKRITSIGNGDLRQGTPILIDQYGLRQFVSSTA
jgi:DNA-binding response OmpR family regulator